MSSRKYRYHTVNLPESLAKKIEEVIESGKHGYTSIPDFVKTAVRRYLRELGYLV
jgi:Arc/MetJ-type ribon-helix-helix transcriptional regulator